MTTKQKALLTLIFSFTFVGTSLSETIMCRAESANIIAGLKSGASRSIEPETLEFAREAALIMCNRKLDFDSQVTEKPNNPDKLNITDPAEQTETKDQKRRGFLGLSFDKSERNEGHRRLQKRN